LIEESLEIEVDREADVDREDGGIDEEVAKEVSVRIPCGACLVKAMGTILRLPVEVMVSTWVGVEREEMVGVEEERERLDREELVDRGADIDLLALFS
jgi:hypothetical protein